MVFFLLPEGVAAMTVITHLLHRARTHPIGLLLGGGAGAAVHHWLAAGSNCATTFLQECTPRPSGAAPAFVAFVLVGMGLGVIVAGTLRDRPGS
jgi:hypothetical protein